MILTVTTALLLAAAPCPVSARWHDAPPPTGMPVEPARNTVQVKGTALLWNDAPAEFGTIVSYGGQIARMQPRPWLVLDASHADCAALQQVAKALGDAAGCDPDHCFVVRKATPRR